jgi:tetratricopeptide (TPR) repeat protein
MQQHYDAAERLQSNRDIHQASLEFRLFIAQALRCIAVDRSTIGEYGRAVPLFERALKLAPNDSGLRLDYAESALATNDFPTARRSSQEVLDASPKGCRDAQCARSHLIVGRALFGEGNMRGAKDEFEAAVDIEPTFDHGYALARAYLGILDKKGAAAIFAEMLSSYGDSAAVHMDFGRAYGEADFPEDAIDEFNKVLARDDHFPEAHYCLGASYLMRSGDTDFSHAEAEFNKELALNPDDYFSLSQLGYIAMSRHNLPEAEADLRRASTLNPENPDNFLLLGQIYADLDRPADAEAALRRAIAVTQDPSRNHYQIRGAHYQLGRLLIARGETREGNREMQITQDLLFQNRMLDQVNLTGRPVAGFQFPAAPAGIPADSNAQAAEQDFEKKAAPAIADSYNNLGGVAAHDGNYQEAVSDFEQSAVWNPDAEGLDYNWGRAAFALKDYRQAAACLARYLKAHPETAAVREPLGMSAFMIGDYATAVRVLSPLAGSLAATPLLAYAYAESLVRTGDYDAGIERLQALEKQDPNLGILPLALGRALASHGNFLEAEPELRNAIRLRPSDAEGKYQLAVTLFALHKESEAQNLLAELTGPDAQATSKDPEVYHRIGQLQLVHGNLKLAILNLECAAKLSPGSPSISEDLRAAYIQVHQHADAQRGRAGRGALLRLVDESGVPVPVGSTATVRATGASVAVGYDGDTYVEGLDLHNEVSVKLANGQHCVAVFDYPAMSGEIPSIGPLPCQLRTP